RQARVDTAAVSAAVGALEAASPSACVASGVGLSIDGQGAGIAGPRPDGAPAASAVGALEDTLGGARVEGGGGLGVDGHGGDCADPHPIGVYQPAVGGAPVGPAVSALENASMPGGRREAGGRLRVDGAAETSRSAP